MMTVVVEVVEDEAVVHTYFLSPCHMYSPAGGKEAWDLLHFCHLGRALRMIRVLVRSYTEKDRSCVVSLICGSQK